MATGKTNSRHIRVYVDDMTPTARDISGSVSNISNFGTTYAEQDVTSYSDGVVNVVLGHPSAEVELTGPMDNTADTGAYTVLKAIVGDESITHTLTVQVGIRAAPASTDPEFEGEYYCSSLMINGDATYSARLVPGSSTAPAWGTVA